MGFEALCCVVVRLLKSFLKAGNQVYFVNFGHFSCLVSESMQIRIHNTVVNSVSLNT